MRSSLIFSVVAAALLVAPLAAAQNAPFQNQGNGNGTSTDDDEDADKPKSYAQRKSWSIGSSFETNRTLLQEDVGGRIKAFNTLSLFASYNITRRDQVRASGGFIQRYIADQGETGIRTDDIGVSYSHNFALPGDFSLVPNVGNWFPTSFNSRLMGLIALPRAGLALQRGFLDNNLFVSLRGGGAYYIVEYRQAVGQADANPRASTNVGLSINYSMPFHQALQVGASASTSWSWSYDVDHANDPTLAEQFRNTPVEPSADPYFTKPATQQNYGWEAYISYNLPKLVDIQSQLQVSLAQGDGALRDGATHLYWLSRRGGQMSASLSVWY